MIYTIDVGNTNIVAGVVDEGGVKFVERCSTDKGKTDLEYAVLFDTIMNLHNISKNDIEGAIISSVVPEINNTLIKAVSKLLKLTPILVGPGIKTGIDIKTDDPAEVGADMIVGAVGSVAEYSLPQIVIDLGTATTISAIDKNGAFIGCAIMAGIKTSLMSITNLSSLLKSISIQAPEKAIGKNTIDSLKSGSVLGSAAMLDGMIDLFEKELGEHATIIATGGLSSYITKYCSHDIICDEELLLKGLYIIYKKNS